MKATISSITLTIPDMMLPNAAKAQAIRTSIKHACNVEYCQHNIHYRVEYADLLDTVGRMTVPI